MRRSVAVKAINTGRVTNRASSVGSDAVVKPTVSSHCGGGSGGRRRTVLVAVTTRVVGSVQVNPVTGSGLTVGVLRRLPPANNHATAVNEELNGRSGQVSGRVEVEMSAVTAASFDALDIVEILHDDTFTGERLLGGRGEVKAGGNSDGDGGKTFKFGRQVFEATIAVRNEPVIEGLLRVAVETICCTNFLTCRDERNIKSVSPW